MLLPGETLTHPIRQLTYDLGTRVRAAWWTEPGRYEVSATWRVLPANPRFASGGPAVTSNAVQLNVTAGSPDLYWRGALDDDDALVRQTAIEALHRRTVHRAAWSLAPADGWAPPGHELAQMRKLTGDPVPGVRRAAVEWLSVHGAAALPALQELRERLSDADAGVRAAAVRALVVVAPDEPSTASDVAARLGDADVGVRRAAADELREPLAWGDGPIADALIQAMEDSDHIERAHAVHSLGRMHANGAAARIFERLKTGEEHADVRLRLISALGALRFSPAIEELEALLEDEKLRPTVEAALQELRDRR